MDVAHLPSSGTLQMQGKQRRQWQGLTPQTHEQSAPPAFRVCSLRLAARRAAAASRGQHDVAPEHRGFPRSSPLTGQHAGGLSTFPRELDNPSPKCTVDFSDRSATQTHAALCKIAVKNEASISLLIQKRQHLRREKSATQGFMTVVWCRKSDSNAR